MFNGQRFATPAKLKVRRDGPGVRTNGSESSSPWECESHVPLRATRAQKMAGVKRVFAEPSSSLFAFRLAGSLWRRRGCLALSLGDVLFLGPSFPECTAPDFTAPRTLITFSH
jgi:hypothetical protein